MRKVLAMPAAIAAACLILGSPSSAVARPRHAARPGTSHKAAAKRHKVSHGSKKAHTRARKKIRSLIYQDPSGKVVLARFSGPAVYGPFLPVEVQDYPRLPCEPVDAVVEVRLHEPDADTPEEPGSVAAGEMSAKASPGFARIAEKVGSLFRPKSAAAVVKPEDVDLSELISQAFRIPVEGVDVERLKDSFLASRGRHQKHLAIDIGAPRGTPIVATTDGEITRITRERRGGKSIYQKDATGQYLLFYCHLSRYAEDLSVGQKVQKGEVIGYVGSTGHVIGGPHLHFSITRLPQDAGSFKQGLAINPYLLFLAGVP